MADTPAADLEAEGSTAPRPRRPLLALWAALAVVAVGAGALVVRSGDDDPPRLPISLGADDGAGRGVAETASAADMTMMAWIRYVAGEDLPALGGDGAAYRLDDGVDVDRLRAVAEALGLDGELREQPDNPGSWQVEAADGSLLGASPYAGGSWWYTSGAIARGDGEGGGSSGSGGSSSSGVACPSEGLSEEELRRCEESAAAEREAAAADQAAADQAAVDEDAAADQAAADQAAAETKATEPSAPPADLPAQEEAERIALDLFRGLGVDVEGARVTVDNPADAWYVNIEPRIDGVVVSGYSFHAGVGPKGAIVTAGGVLDQPDRLGDYPTVDTRAAIDRLNEQMGTGPGGGREPAVAADDTGATAAEADDTVSILPVEECPAADPAAEDLAADGAPACGSPQSEPTEVVLHEAERILVLVSSFEGDGESFLVPGYRMRGDDGAQVDVVAVDDASLLPPPPATEPAPPPSDGGEPGSVDGCAPVEPGPDGAAPDICLDPGSVPPSGPAGTSSADPDQPVESPPSG